MRLLTLPDTLRSAGITTHEVGGWEGRGYDFDAKPKVVVGHHTASSTGSPMPSLHILTYGRSDLPGPLCQVGISRRAEAYVIAAGKANHAGPGRWKDVMTSSLTVGIEVENNGVGEPWSQDVLDCFDLTAAALLDLIDQPADMYCGHREWALPAGRKIDPAGIDLDDQRARIAALLDGGLGMALSDDDKAWIKAQIDASNQDLIRSLMVYKLRDGDAVGTILRNTEARTERLVGMVRSLARGDVADVEKQADAVIDALREALAE